jgi:hypothetical protein
VTASYNRIEKLPGVDSAKLAYAKAMLEEAMSKPQAGNQIDG